MLTVVVADATGWGWAVYGASVAVFILLFEVGLVYLVSAAWGSHRQLEYEGFLAVMISLYQAGLDDDAVREKMGLTPEALQRLKAQLALAAGEGEADGQGPSPPA